MHAVFTPDKSTKLRLVFDASAKGPEGLSLNDYLEKGPNYINSIPDVLMAWRWDNVAFCGDLRKMFNQILIHPEDQVYHRFLFKRSSDKEPTVFQWLRLNFGDKPAPDIATGAINVLAKDFQDQLPEASKLLQEQVYVDDIGGSSNCPQNSEKLMRDIDTILHSGNFQVKVWHSNDKSIDKSNDCHTYFLGHKWDKESDKLMFKREEIISNQNLFTKRRCLALVSQLWDPLGLVSPVTIKFRVDLQDLWAAGYSWDKVLPDNIQKKWVENLQVLNQLLSNEFERKLKPDNAIGKPEVHGFCDGGEQAYGAVIYLRWKLKNGNYRCTPIMVKSFVSPLKKKSIPRLELLGCLVLTRLYCTCAQALKFAHIEDCKRVLWTDSKTALSWIKTPARKFKPFVSARVAEIQENINVKAFKYTRSKENPADALTRGINAEQLQTWSAGPNFLRTYEVCECNESDFKEDECSNEEYKSELKEKELHKEVESRSCDITQENNAENAVFKHLLTSCSSFSKTRRTLAYIRRFAKNVQNKVNKMAGPLTTQELKQSETTLFKWCQQDFETKTLDKKLKVGIDETTGLLRAYGRLENIKSLPKDMRQPIIIPRNHPLGNQILRHLHEKRGHCGYKSLIYEMRKRFWMVGVRSSAKHLTRNCVICKKLRQRPLEQLMGQIPNLRVATGLPVFTNTALDMFGPIQIKMHRKTYKEAQVVIFTCMTTRAIHLELVTDRSTDTFLMAFRRFACTRGHPNTCWSDCGTNFVGAQAYLKEIMCNWDIPRIQSILTEEFTCDFKWEFNVPKASHQNGVVESLIKSVRQAMNTTCKDWAYTEEQWHTFLKEITYMINSRPLYPASDDIWAEPPITPNDLIIGQHNQPPIPEEESKVNPRNLLRSCQKRTYEFWKAWMKYFAPNLLPRNKWFRIRENIKIGDLILELDTTPRRRWKMGIVTNTYPGTDGMVRKVQIKTSRGTYDRPINKLCLIATKEELEQNQ